MQTNSVENQGQDVYGCQEYRSPSSSDSSLVVGLGLGTPTTSVSALWDLIASSCVCVADMHARLTTNYISVTIRLVTETTQSSMHTCRAR
jgi:hypothetical protein